MKLSYILNGFLDEYCRKGGDGKDGMDDILRMTTREVKERIIGPNTKDYQSSFCDMLQATNHPAFGAMANVFVSHAHGCEFWNTIHAVKRCLSKDNNKDYEDVVVWMDVFSINQHQPNVWTTDWLCDTFRDSIGRIGHTIMVMSPWDRPAAFTRSWCIYEAYVSLDTGAKFDIAMGEDDEKQFLNYILTAEDDDSAMTVMNKLLSYIQAENSQCMSKEERERIFDVIRERVGFEKVDTMVLRQYVNWLVAVLTDVLQGKKNFETDRARLQSIVRRLRYERQWN